MNERTLCTMRYHDLLSEILVFVLCVRSLFQGLDGARRVATNNDWITVGSVHVQPNCRSGEFIYCAMYTQTARFQFIITVHTPHEIWARMITQAPPKTMSTQFKSKFRFVFSVHDNNRFRKSTFHLHCFVSFYVNNICFRIWYAREVIIGSEEVACRDVTPKWSMSK